MSASKPPSTWNPAPEAPREASPPPSNVSPKAYVCRCLRFLDISFGRAYRPKQIRNPRQGNRSLLCTGFLSVSRRQLDRPLLLPERFWIAGLVNRPERTTYDQTNGDQGSSRLFKLLNFFFKPVDTQISEHHDPSTESHTTKSQVVWPLVGFAGFFISSSALIVEWRIIWYCNPERRARERSNSNCSPFSSIVCLQPIPPKFSGSYYSISNGETFYSSVNLPLQNLLSVISVSRSTNQSGDSWGRQDTPATCFAT